MPASFYYSVKKTLKENDLIYVFVTVDNNETVFLKLLEAEGTVLLPDIFPGQHVLITILVPSTSGRLFEIAGSAYGKFSEVATENSHKPINLKRCSSRGPTIQDGGGKVSSLMLDFFKTEHKRGRTEYPLYEYRVVPTAAIDVWDLSHGHPSLQRVWFASGNPVASGLWDRYVKRACILFGLKENSSLDARSLRCMLSVVLQGCTGYYQRERADDRGSIDIKFGQNADCDDEAATVCALFYALKEEGVSSDWALSESLRRELMAFSEAVVVCGMARPPCGNARSTPFGHAWATLLMEEASFEDVLHIEATAPMVTDAPVELKQHASRLYDNAAYNAKTKNFCSHTRAQMFMIGVRETEPFFYGVPNYAVGRRRQYMWPKLSSPTCWIDIVSKSASFVSPPARKQSSLNRQTVFHKVDRTQHLPALYNRGPWLTPLMCPDDWEAIVVLPPDTPKEQQSVVDSFQVWEYFNENGCILKNNPIGTSEV